MKHSGKARKAAFRLILIALVPVVVAWGIGFAVPVVAHAIAPAITGLWVLFTVFTLYFFRDPEARVPADANLVLAPGHGTVDVIDTVSEPVFVGGDCQRVSIFLSVFNVHVQNAPVGGKITYLKYTPGQFLNALKTDSAVHNENVLVGFTTSAPAGTKVGVRFIAGLIARRIVPFVQAGDEVGRGERIGLIQFGSRLDVYLPRTARIQVKLGDKVVGGETVLAAFA